MLLSDWFTQMQYSVDARRSLSQENADVHIRRIEHHIPPDGEVRILTFTDKQFERMRVFMGKTRKSAETGPQQLEFF